MQDYYRGSKTVMGDACTVAATGDLDIYSAPQFKQDLSEAMDQHAGPLVVDLTAVAFIDSTALGVLIGVLRRMVEQDRTLVLVIRERRIARLFSITGLDKVFTIVESRHEAVGALKIDRKSARAA